MMETMIVRRRPSTAGNSEGRLMESSMFYVYKNDTTLK